MKNNKTRLNTFDKWMEYDNLEIEDYTLYRVYSTKNMILNKRYNILYGLILKRLNYTDFKIQNFKKPSFVVDCDYSTLVNNLWNTEITDDVKIDKSIKQIINTVVIGQLEKGINRAQSSCISHTLEEARGYQTLNGRTLNLLTKQDELTTVEIVDVCPKTGNNIDIADMIGYVFRDDIFTYGDCSTGNLINVSVRLIYGPKRIKYEKQQLVETQLLYDITCNYRT